MNISCEIFMKQDNTVCSIYFNFICLKFLKLASHFVQNTNYIL